MSLNRKIIHIDMDAFFASVEQRDFPELRGKPVIVGGHPGQRGVVAAASYEARAFGIHSAMPSSRAHRLCPEAVFVKARFEVYRKVSEQVRSIFRQFTDLVEPLSLDEAFLDVTDNKKSNPSATWIAKEIRQMIFVQTNLTASAGVAPNKFLAKIASDINKPNGMYVIPPNMTGTFIAKLPIGKFFGIGKATEKKMHELGIFSGADLKTWEETELIRHFGKSGHFYYEIARGRDGRAVSPHRIRKSVGVEETYDVDLVQLDRMKKELDTLGAVLAGRLGKAKLAGKTITLKLRYGNFDTVTRSQSQSHFVAEASRLSSIAKELLEQNFQEGQTVRLLGITVSNLNNQPKPSSKLQLALPFDDDW